jgi:hypothetical protein
MRDYHVFPRVTQLGQQAPGMELRDLFAAMVLQAACQENSPWDAARMAYEYADVMMEVRGQ